MRGLGYRLRVITLVLMLSVLSIATASAEPVPVTLSSGTADTTGGGDLLIHNLKGKGFEFPGLFSSYGGPGPFDLVPGATLQTRFFIAGGDTDVFSYEATVFGCTICHPLPINTDSSWAEDCSSMSGRGSCH
jgi:hypothetical protein